MQVVLVMFLSNGERRSFSVARDLTVIGRREDCDLRIPVGDVSRKHCRLVKEADTMRVEDLGSSNGTYVNNNRVQEAVLSPGDVVRVGPVQFVVQIDGLPTDEELKPPAAPLDPEDTGLAIEPEGEDSFAAVLEELPGGASGANPTIDEASFDSITEEPPRNEDDVRIDLDESHS